MTCAFSVDYLLVFKESVVLITLVCGALTALVPPWRSAVWKVMVKAQRSWQRWTNSEIFAKQEEIMRMISEGVPKWEDSVRLSKDNNREILLLKAIVTNGLSHSVARLAAQHRQEFEASREPKFVCDETGSNWLVSAGYKALVGMDAEGLRGQKWHNALSGDLKERYIEEFERAAAAREDFVSVCDFQHPITGEHRGRWRVFASCDVVNSAAVYTGRFVKAEDDKAQHLTRVNGWTLINDNL